MAIKNEEKMRIEARKVVKRYSAEDIMEKWISLFESKRN